MEDFKWNISCGFLFYVFLLFVFFSGCAGDVLSIVRCWNTDSEKGMY